MNPQTDNRPRTVAAALAIFTLLLLSYVVNAMDRQVFPLLVQDVRNDYGFSLSSAGTLSTIFTLGLGLAGIPTGYFLARYSRKSLVVVGIFLFSAATLLTAFAAGFWDMLAYRLVSGVGEAMQLTALLAIATAYFQKHRAAAIGAVNLCFALGAIVGPRAGGHLLGSSGDWRVPLEVFAVVGFVCMVAIAVAARPWFTETSPTGRAELTRITRGETPLRLSVLLNRNTIALVVASAACGLLLYGYVGMYPTFLREDLGFSPAQAGDVMSIFGFGALLSVAGGWLGDKLPPRPVLSTFFLVALVLGLLMFNGPASVGLQSTLSFIWGATISSVVYVNLAGAHAKALPSEFCGWASGLFVASLYIPAAFSGYLVGWLAEFHGWSLAGSLVIGVFAIVGSIASLLVRAEQLEGKGADHALGKPRSVGAASSNAAGA